MTNTTRIDHIVDRIYRISTFSPEFGITFNQFLIDDEQPALIHTGTYEHYEGVRSAIAEVLDPTRLAHIVLLHWEGDENGGMDRFMAQASESQLVGSALSIMLNASGFGLHTRTRAFMDGQTLRLGAHRLRFLETPHVHNWDSMMVVEETTNSLFPSDLYLQPGDQPPVSGENLTAEMLEVYRGVARRFRARAPVVATPGVRRSAPLERPAGPGRSCRPTSSGASRPSPGSGRRPVGRRA